MCPACSGAAGDPGEHCTTDQRKTPCGWLICPCGAIYRGDGRFIPRVPKEKS